MTGTFWCADCRTAAATVFLPEGRYLCRTCAAALRALRQAVHTDTARRMAERRRAHR
jgi:hypothetical protein